VLHADATPAPLIDPRAGKTKKEFDAMRGVCVRLLRRPGRVVHVNFLAGWNGTQVCDESDQTAVAHRKDHRRFLHSPPTCP